MRRNLAIFALIFVATFAGAQQATAPAPHPAHHAHAPQPVQSPVQIWTELIDGNKRFVSGKAEYQLDTGKVVRLDQPAH